MGEKREKKPTVSAFAMFRYADRLDKLYMVLGTLAAVIHGTALPLMMVVFGDMTDSFANAGSSISSNITNQSMPIIIVELVLVCLLLLTFRFHFGAWQLEDRYTKLDKSFSML